MSVGIWGLYFKIADLIGIVSNDTAKRELAILAFLYYGEIVKTPIVMKFKVWDVMVEYEN